MNNTVIPN